MSIDGVCGVCAGCSDREQGSGSVVSGPVGDVAVLGVAFFFQPFSPAQAIGRGGS